MHVHDKPDMAVEGYCSIDCPGSFNHDLSETDSDAVKTPLTVVECV